MMMCIYIYVYRYIYSSNSLYWNSVRACIYTCVFLYVYCFFDARICTGLSCAVGPIVLQLEKRNKSNTVFG